MNNKISFFEIIGNYQRLDWLFSKLSMVIALILGIWIANTQIITIIKIIITVLMLVLLTLQVLVNICKKRKGHMNFDNIKLDGTKIIRFDNNLLVWKEMSRQDYKIWNQSFKKRYVFVALTVSNDINIIQFSILGKLMQLQKAGFIPIIYLSFPIIKIDAPEKRQMINAFKKMIRFYLGQKCRIVGIDYNRYSKSSVFSSSEINSFLEKTTYNEFKEALSNQKIRIEGDTSLRFFLAPILEIFSVSIYYGMKKGITTLCCESFLSIWKLGCKKIPTMALPVFATPTLYGLNNMPVRPHQLSDVLNINWTDSQIVKRELNNKVEFSALISIYKFFIFPIILKKESLLTISDKSIVYNVSNINEIDHILEKIDIQVLINDLIDKIPNLVNEIRFTMGI